ncbi:MAG TPA: ATP-binding cassette domain-containing protein, partial [Myxococcaceae bacterium]
MVDGGVSRARAGRAGAGGERGRRRAPGRARSEAARRGVVSIALEGLNVSLRRTGADVPLVQDVSFRIEPGRVLGLVGESGAGKSLTAAA